MGIFAILDSSSGTGLWLRPPHYACGLVLEKIKDRSILKSIQNEASANPESCTVRVTIARLSPDEFVTYAALEGGYNAVTYQKAVEVRKRERSRLGWKGRSSSDTYGRETSEDRSNEAEHRYCTVSHQAI